MTVTSRKDPRMTICHSRGGLLVQKGEGRNFLCLLMVFILESGMFLYC